MDIEQAFQIYALAHAGLAALIGTRLFYGSLPDPCQLPALVYFLVDDPHDHTTDLGRARLQVTSWGTSFAEAKALDKQVDAAFTRFKGIMGGAKVSQGVTVAGPYDMDPETAPDGSQRFGRARDIELIYRGE
jgi:hypothetical protein